MTGELAMIICGTGHRPNKLGGYTMAVENKQIKIAYDWLKLNKPTKIISGMALGWDQAIARVGIDLSIPVVAALPFENHHAIWPHWQIERYTNLLAKCSEIKLVCEGGFEKWKMQKRNEWMVDNCDLVLALWNGSVGGTSNCIAYAKQLERPIINLWEQWRDAA